MHTDRKFHISVVIPTFNRENLLAKCLAAMQEQNYDPEKFEVLVVEDVRSPAGSNLEERLPRDVRLPRNVRFLESKKNGPAAARNVGWNKAASPIVAFTDDDCLPQPDWLNEIERSFRRPQNSLDGEPAGSGGPIVSAPECTDLFTHQVEHDHPYGFPTCNVAYKKNRLRKAGGFDESLFPNEDWDMAFRIQKYGRIKYNRKQIVIHPPRTSSFLQMLTKNKSLETEFTLYQKNPDAYRCSVQRHPLRVLLYHQMLVQLVKKIRKSKPFLFKNPPAFIKFMALLIAERIYLLILLPSFIIRSGRLG